MAAGGDLTVSQAVNSGNGDIALDAGGALRQGNANIDAGTGTVGATGGGVNQSGSGVVKAAALAVEVASASSLTNAGNQVARFAARTSGAGSDLALLNGDALEVASVGGLNGVDAAGKVSITVPGSSVTLSQAVSGIGTGSNTDAVVINAGTRFHNMAGSTAVVANSGRWLVYDDNLYLQDMEMGGLQRDFLRLAANWVSYPPYVVSDTGNGDLTTGPNTATPQVFQMPATVAGDSSASMLMARQMVVHQGQAEAGTASAQAVSSGMARVNRVGDVFALHNTAKPFGLFSAGADGSVMPLAVPVQLAVTPGQHFGTTLTDIIGGGQLLGGPCRSAPGRC